MLARVGEVDRGLAFDDSSLAWVFGAGPPPAGRPRIVVAWLADPTGDVAERLAASAGDRALVAPSRPVERGGVHCARHLLASLAPLGVVEDLDDRPLAVAPRAGTSIFVHPGSGAPRKNWPPERFAAVCEIVRGRGQPVTLIAGEADAEPVDAVARAVGGPVEVLRQPDLLELAARLAGCRAYLGNDSGVSHLAGLVGARAVVLFGPTSPAVWAPLGPRVRVRRFADDPELVARSLLG